MMVTVPFSILFLKFGVTLALDAIPVFIQDDGLLDSSVKSQNNPFVKTNQEEFELIIDTAEKIAESMIFFIEEEFSFEDVSSKDEKGTPFYYLRKAFLNKRVKMFPRVIEPYNYLKNRFQPFDFNTFHVRSTTSRIKLEEHFKFMYIFFEDGTNETRVQKLRRHDAILQEVYFTVKQLANGPVIALYTGKFNPVEISYETPDATMRSKQDTSPKTNTTIANCGNATFQFVDAMVKPIGGKPTPLEVTKCEYIVVNDDVWSYYITFVENNTSPSSHYQLRYSFTNSDPDHEESDWKLIKIVYYSKKGKLKTQFVDIHDSWNTYYESSAPLLMAPEPEYPFEPTLSVQVYRVYLNKDKLVSATTAKPNTTTEKTTTEKTTTTTVYPVKSEGPTDGGRQGSALSKTRGSAPSRGYGELPKGGFRTNNDSETAETYLTLGIATGLFVVNFLLWILFFGVSMIMSISTNSIYDSPDAKPLFNADLVGD